MTTFRVVARQDKFSGISSKQDQKSITHATSKRHFNALSNKQFSSYHLISNNLQNSKQNIDHEFVPRPARSSINFSFANIQTKLKVSQPGDVYEQEADRIADRIMKNSDNSESYSPTKDLDNTRIDRKCESCVDEEKEENQMKISRKGSSSTNTTNQLAISEDAEKDINNTLNQSGSPLDSSTREFMESRFGYDFSSVRIHTNEGALSSARSMNSLAYTIGNDIAFDEGQYMPDSLEGKRLLAHELTHVVQQGYGDSILLAFRPKKYVHQRKRRKP